MIAEAIDTLITLGWAFLGWLIVFAITGTISIFAALATGAWAYSTLRRTIVAPAWARSRRAARRYARREPDYEEAA
ncbi:hypothetical protein ACIQ6R_13150 [Streptomyces sp. NPDC096048]|uniref:hypothetical protein n=1 Tax=Streptomyces sp. NPDC096048 TaxID=3366072 RepID=UPI0037F3EF5C